MIEKLRGIAIFATVVDQGTFRAASRHLGLAPSRISQSVSNLEKQLGVTLLYRSTRRLSLTGEGRILYEKAQQMLVAAESGLDAINLISDEPAGELRITAPAFATQTNIMDKIADFATAHPNVTLKLQFSDVPIDLIKDGYDVAIRAGWLENSELQTRNLGEVKRLLVASPKYLEGKPKPLHPRDLEQFDWVRFSMRADQTELLAPDGEVMSVTGRSNVTVDAADSLYEFATRGLGLTAIPETLACRGFERGELVHVLPDWTLKPLGLHAIWPDNSRRENLTLLFVRFLAGENQG